MAQACHGAACLAGFDAVVLGECRGRKTGAQTLRQLLALQHLLAQRLGLRRQVAHPVAFGGDLLLQAGDQLIPVTGGLFGRHHALEDLVLELSQASTEGFGLGLEVLQLPGVGHPDAVQPVTPGLSLLADTLGLDF